MALREELEKSGVWLFRWRSYLPLVMLGLVIFGLRHFRYPGGSHQWDQVWDFACFVLSLSGIGVRVAAVGCAPKGTSGRNVKNQVADTLTTTGMYSIARHPLYLGNFLIGLGILLFPRLWWITLLYVLTFWLYYERIMFAEEEFLRRKFGAPYLEWADRTPAFFPNLSRWQPTQMSFSIRWALKREYASVFGVIAVYTFLEVAGDFFAEGRLVVDTIWLAIFVTGAVGYALLRFIGKKTTLLNVEGR